MTWNAKDGAVSLLNRLLHIRGQALWTARADSLHRPKSYRTLQELAESLEIISECIKTEWSSLGHFHAKNYRSSGKGLAGAYKDKLDTIAGAIRAATRVLESRVGVAEEEWDRLFDNYPDKIDADLARFIADLPKILEEC